MRGFACEQGGEQRHGGGVAAAPERRDHADLQISLQAAERLPQGLGRLGRGDPLEGRPGHVRVFRLGEVR
ncbi:MAG: hypothetical protein ACKOHK_05290, partial [Planctomycetia bacterium]